MSSRHFWLALNVLSCINDCIYTVSGKKEPAVFWAELQQILTD